MARVHGKRFLRNDIRQHRSRLDGYFVRQRDRASSLMIDGRLNMLQKRPAAIDIQDLQAITDAEHRLVHVVGIL